MMVVFVRFVQRCSIALHPGMRFKFFCFLADPDAQLRGNSLPPKQPPESQRFRQAGRVNKPEPVRGIDHVYGHCSVLVHENRIMFLRRIGKEQLQACLRGPKTAPSQTQSHQRQQHYGAQKKFLRRAFQRPKSPEPFPHQQEEPGAIRYRQAGLEVPSSWREAIPVRHRTR